MARAELGYELSGAVFKAASTHADAVAENVKVHTDGGVQLVCTTFLRLWRGIRPRRRQLLCP